MKKTYVALAVVVACAAATACTNPVQSPAPGESAPQRKPPVSGARQSGGIIVGSGGFVDPSAGQDGMGAQ